MLHKICIVAVLFLSVLVGVVCAESVERKGVRGATTANENQILDRELQTKSIGFQLKSAATGNVINNLVNGDKVNLGSTSPSGMTIEVKVSGYSFAPVKITLSGATSIEKVESGTIALCGNLGTKLFACPSLKLGNYKIKAELYTGSGATGTMVASSEANFSLAGISVPIQPPVTAPVMVPVVAPVMAPVAVPVSNPDSCTVPKVR
jgi:hypothetical protein